jgi:hypothetical protein
MTAEKFDHIIYERLPLASPETVAAAGSKWSRGPKEPSLLWMQFRHFSGLNLRLSPSIIVVGCCGSRIVRSGVIFAY